VTVLHSGSNNQYSSNWVDAFGKGKSKAARKKASPKKKASAKKATVALKKGIGKVARKKAKR
jgi:hypothetical protein